MTFASIKIIVLQKNYCDMIAHIFSIFFFQYVEYRYFNIWTYLQALFLLLSTRSKLSSHFQCEAWRKRGGIKPLLVFLRVDALLIWHFWGCFISQDLHLSFIVIKYAGALYFNHLGLKTLYTTFQRVTPEQVSEVTIKQRWSLC